MSGKREDYISWDEYFMAVAKLAGMRSKDPNTQVGACIVSADHKILSIGYMPMILLRTNIFMWPTGNLTPYLITAEGLWKAQRYMSECFRATNAQKQLSKAV